MKKLQIQNLNKSAPKVMDTKWIEKYKNTTTFEF